jgi:hypothetical protein
MEVLGLWRHAVKSLQGERLESARFEDDGLVGDRRWGIRDLRTGRILTARRRPELLGAAASYDGELPMITLPDGCTAVGPGQHTDGLLSRWLGSPVSLVASAGNAGERAEYFADATDDNSQAIEWTMPAGRFVQKRFAPVRSAPKRRAPPRSANVRSELTRMARCRLTGWRSCSAVRRPITVTAACTSGGVARSGGVVLGR